MRALHDVSLSLYPGQVTALIGENGAGKSTLVKILTGIYQPDAGEISVDGQPVTLCQRRMPPSSTASPPSIRKRCCSTTSPSPRTSSSATRRAPGFGTHRLEHACAPTRAKCWTRMRCAAYRRRRAAEGPRHRQQASGRGRARHVDRRADRHHGRADRRALAQGDRGPLPLIEFLKQRGQGDPVHQPQVRRDLPHRRPLHGVPRRRVGRRRADRATPARARSSRMMVGRAVDHIFPKREAADRRAGARRSQACRIRPSSTTSASSCARARSSASTAWSAPGAARSCRRCSASRGPAAARSRSTASRSRRARRRTPSMPASSMCRRSAASRAWCIGMPIFQNVSLPSLQAHLEVGRAAAGGGVRAGPRLHRAARPARLLAQPGCRHAVGRQPAEGRHRQMAGDRRPRSSSSTSRPRASTSAPRPPCTASWPSSSREGLSVIMVSSELPEILGMSDRVRRHARGPHRRRLRQRGARRRDAGAAPRRGSRHDQSTSAQAPRNLAGLRPSSC